MNLIILKRKFMLKQEQHQRLRTMAATKQAGNEQVSLSESYWYALTFRSIVPIDNTRDDIHKRSGYTSQGI